MAKVEIQYSDDLPSAKGSSMDDIKTFSIGVDDALVPKGTSFKNCCPSLIIASLAVVAISILLFCSYKIADDKVLNEINSQIVIAHPMCQTAPYYQHIAGCQHAKDLFFCGDFKNGEFGWVNIIAKHISIWGGICILVILVLRTYKCNLEVVKKDADASREFCDKLLDLATTLKPTASDCKGMERVINIKYTKTP